MAEVASAYVSLMFSAKGSTDQLTREVAHAGAKAGDEGGHKASKGFASRFSVKGVRGKLTSEVSSAGGHAGEAGGKHAGEKFTHSLKHHLSEHLREVGTMVAGAFALEGGLEFFKGSVEEARKFQKVSNLTNAVLKSTGGTAHVTAGEVDELSRSLAEKSGVDHGVIQSGANLLLTFRNVRNEAGEGNDVFTQATKVMTDMGAALHKGPTLAAKLLGKALNDPVKGMSALTRVGAAFTDQQKLTAKALTQGGILNALGAFTGATVTAAQFAKVQKDQKLSFQGTVNYLTGPMTKAQTAYFRHLQEGGHTVEAQRMILKALNKEYAGSAAATATWGEKAKVAFNDLKEQVGSALLPYIDAFEKKLVTTVLPAVTKFLDQMKSGEGRGGELVHHLKVAFDGVRDAVEKAWQVGKKFVGVWNGLPSGVKKAIGIGVGAGYLASKIPGGKSLIGTATHGLLGGGAVQRVFVVNMAGGLGGAAAGAAESEAGAAAGASRASRVAGAGKAALRKAGIAVALVIAGHAVAQGVTEGLGKVGSRGTDAYGFQRKKSGVSSFLFGGGHTLKNDVGAALGARTGIGRLDQKIAGVLGGDSSTASIKNVQRLDAALASVAKRNPAKAQAAFRHVLAQAGVSAAKLTSILPQMTQALKDARVQAAEKLNTSFTTGASKAIILAGVLRKTGMSAKEYHAKLSKLPALVQTKLTTPGAVTSKAQVKELARQYDLTPKQIKTMTKLAGINAAVTDAAKARAAYAKIPRWIHTKVTVAQADRNPSSYKPKITLDGARAAGGPVGGGKLYLVGEHGPELFRAPSAGVIVPHSALQPGGLTPAHQGTRGGHSGPLFHIDRVEAQDVNHLLREMQHRGRAMAGGGVAF